MAWKDVLPVIPVIFLTCALALGAVSSPELSNADVTFFGFLGAMVPELAGLNDEGMVKVLAVQKPILTWDELTKYTSQVAPQGFLIADIRPESLRRWLRDMRWELLPFYHRGRAIYRKPNHRVREGA